jgi:hypothetical protein
MHLGGHRAPPRAAFRRTAIILFDIRFAVDRV